MSNLYRQHWIDEDDIQAVVNVLKSDYLTCGPKIDEFEKRIAKAAGAEYAAAVSNGTAALHAACFAAGIGEGDEVVTSPMTFAASANCVLYMGAKPVFADIDPKTYNISPEDIKRKITRKTRAVIPVHYTGQPCDMDEILKIAREYGLTVIEDGAHAIGAVYRGRKIGSIGDMTTFSFHPVKHITTGEGGAVATNSRDIYKKLVMFRAHGITRDRELMAMDGGPWYYEQHYPGYNYRMPDILAVLGISQIDKLDRFLLRRREIAARYDSAFESNPAVIRPFQLDNTNSAWHLYVIRLVPEKLNADRRTVYEELKRMNTGVNVHYIPVYYHPYYQKLGYRKGLCPNAEELYERIVTLPVFPAMTDRDVDYVIHCVGDVIARYGK